MLRYAIYQAALRSGWLRRRSPIRSWEQQSLRDVLLPEVPSDAQGYLHFRGTRVRPPRFFHASDEGGRLPTKVELAAGAADLLEEADGILHGEFRLFGGPARSLGFPPRWDAFLANEDQEAPPLDLKQHWSAYDTERVGGDIKLLWEASRFGWVFPLVRAYRLTENPRYAQGLWALVESWCQANRPNAGPHWLSAQEPAFRLIALVFALHGLEPWILSEAERVATLTRMIAVHASRIPLTLNYSRSLANNHLVVETVALYTAGVLFPELRGAKRWRALGRRWICASLEAQFLPDGAHIQHSTNYQRLVLEAGLWAARLGEANDEAFPPSTMAALRRGAELLRTVCDEASGRVPNFGPNDGAQLLPLTSCGFGDYRPVLQLSAAECDMEPMRPGPWDELCQWLGLQPRQGEVPRPPGQMQVDFPNGGLHLLNGSTGRGILRCARFTTRPGHSDQLHLDLHWRGNYVGRDPGSYLYTGAAPWDNALARAEVHNTVVVDRQEPMRRAGRFLWLDWAQGTFLGRWSSPHNALEVIAAQHDGYRRMGVTHRRTVVRAGDDLWVVADDLLGEGEHSARVVWQLPDWSAPQLRGESVNIGVPGGYLVLQMEVPGDLFVGPSLRLGLFRAGELVAGEWTESACPAWGWYSPTYAAREPSLTLVAETSSGLPLRLLSWWSFGADGKETLQADWAPPGRGLAALASVGYGGEWIDILP